MSNEKNIRIVKGSERFAGSQDKDISLQPLLTSDQKELIQGDRNLVLNLRDQFGLEREYSQRYRITGKIDVLYKNVISGETTDTNFLKYMYFTPKHLGCPDATVYTTAPNAGPPCTGKPPAMLFDLIPRFKFGAPGNPSLFNNLNAYQENKVLYLSYVFSSTCETMRYYVNPGTNDFMDFNACDGIPFEVEIVTVNGREVARFRTKVPHGVKVGEHIELQSTPNVSGGANLVQNLTTGAPNVLSGGVPVMNQPPATFNILNVDSLGDGFAGSEEFVINVDLRGVQPLPTNPVGVFKRIINLNNVAESRSQYYVHQHKIITNHDDYTLDRTGFEEGIYNKKGRVYTSRKTPDQISKQVVLEDFPSYVFCFTRDINVENYFDNLNRPLTELYVTVLPTNRNNMWDWSANSPAGYGWSWNFQKIGVVDPFVDNTVVPINPINLTQTTNDGVQVLPISGHTFRGAFVEYNELELKERVISEIKHSLKFNTSAMYEIGTAGDPVKSIYAYTPHHRMHLRKFSNTIVDNDTFFTSPQYCTYSQVSNEFRWRPILPIEFYEDDDNGVSYPYLNDAHYFNKNIEFTVEPVLHNYTAQTLNIVNPYEDDCE